MKTLMNVTMEKGDASTSVITPTEGTSVSVRWATGSGQTVGAVRWNLLAELTMGTVNRCVWRAPFGDTTGVAVERATNSKVIVGLVN